MKKYGLSVVSALLLFFSGIVSTAWAQTYTTQIESVLWTNQGGVQLYDSQGTLWPGVDGFDGVAGTALSPPYELGIAETPIPALTGTQAAELATLPVLASYDVVMPNYGDASATNWLPIHDAEFIVNYKIPPTQGLAYNMSIMGPPEVTDFVSVALIAICGDNGATAYEFKLIDENGTVSVTTVPDFSTIALRISIDGTGGATASYSLDPSGDITDPSLLTWQTIPGTSDLDSELATAGRYGPSFNISTSCSAQDCNPGQGFPQPNVAMQIKKMKVSLKNGKFEIKGYLDVNDPDFAQLVQNPQAGLALFLQTGGTADDPEFGIVAQDGVSLKTKGKKLTSKSGSHSHKHHHAYTKKKHHHSDHD